MSGGFEVTSDMLGRAEKVLKGIPGAAEKAVARALNRALVSGRAEAVRAARSEYTIKAAAVRADFSGMKRARPKDLTAELGARGSPKPLSVYKHAPTSDTTGAKRTQVRVAVKKGGLKPLGQAYIHGGRVMRRLGATRLPVEQKYGPSVPAVLGNMNVSEQIMDKMSETAESRLDHEILWALEEAEK